MMFRRIVTVFATAVVMGVLVLGTAQAATADIKPCKSGGYVNYIEPATNAPFRNQGNCVTFVKRGGELRPVSPVQVVTSSLVNVAYPDPDRTTFQVTAAGLTPYSPAYIYLATTDGTVIWRNTGWADTDGEWLYPGIQVSCGFGPLTVTVGDSTTGVESAPLPTPTPSSCATV